MGRDLSGGREPEHLANALAQLARNLLRQPTVQATLREIVSASIKLVDGCTDASVMVVHRGGTHVLAASSSLARDCDEMQARLGEGPCFAAARDNVQSVRITDMTRADERWPRFVRGARELGMGSMLAFLLFTDIDDPKQPNLGSLNLYTRESGALTDRSEQIGWLLASHAAVALAGANSEENLHAAISSNRRIGEATGILMERHRITGDDAFALLSRASQNHNIKLRHVAERLIETRQLPDAR
ncbi:MULTISPECIES: GAF and ANTAR domain-containing protein [Actinomadura]|uniref:GAF domain-containing protein n=1 Tax=Actinomadura madurae TaxID=1993 RepID=A0A1I5P8S0_9ACTN|nr:GAF and ANTAR domain-containing protein [Actinomadura madurae]SFP30509.1 GAF domain-containing protein [Actinomadura madurae]SPT63841.1 ANTAR domain [Actinomadura madurae]